MEEREISFYDELNIREDATTAEVKQAYRRLSAVFHPDKQQDESLKEEAAVSFTKIKDAYEVLVDEQKRRIYDLYGKEGLEAGLELAATEADQEFVRQQWERFKGRAFLQDVHRQAAPRTIVELKVDARKPFKDFINGVIPSVWPVIAEATASTDVNVQMNDRLILKIGCQMKMVRRGQKPGQQDEVDLEAGDMEGNWRVPCSLQVQASDRDTVQLDGNFGREAQVLALSSQRVLTPEDTGTVAATFSPAGLGLQAGLTRQLHQSLRGEVLWVMGPPDDAGVTLNLVQTHENWSLSGKLQLGAATALRGVAAYKLRAGTTLVSVANVGTTGIYAEAGVKQQWGDSVSSQVTVHHGLMGSSIKIRVTRAGHTVMVPVYVSDRYQDWQTLLVALTMPVVVNVLISSSDGLWCGIGGHKAVGATDAEVLARDLQHRVVVHPLLWLHRTLQSARGERSLQKEVATAKQQALQQQELLQASVARLAAEEDRRSGLVIVRAAYGNTASFRARLEQQAAMFAQHTRAASGSTEAKQQRAAAPDGWLDITGALQFLVVDSQVHLLERSSRSHLMGFADLHTEGGDRLYVLYKWQDRFFEMDVEGREEATIPSGEALELGDDRALFAQHLLHD